MRVSHAYIVVEKVGMFWEGGVDSGNVTNICGKVGFILEMKGGFWECCMHVFRRGYIVGWVSRFWKCHILERGVYSGRQEYILGVLLIIVEKGVYSGRKG